MCRRSQSAPTPGTTVQGYSPRFSKFFSEEPLPSNSFVHDHEFTPAVATSTSLRETRHRFSKKPSEPTKDDEERVFFALDRRAVLNVYDEAILRLGTQPEKHIQIAAECTRKVRVILGIINADPTDPVFTTTGQLLAPLEPQYANPRIGFADDQEGHRAQWRLERWKKEGWPDEYPAKAVRREEKEKGERLVGIGRVKGERLRKRSQEEDGIVDFDEGEDRRRKVRQVNMRREEQNRVREGDVREKSVSKEWDDMEFSESDDWS
jgi:hypothetical protein